MIKIGLLSDTHGYISERTIKFFENVDEIWHAGDIGNIELADRLAKLKKFRAVYGNIDGGILRTMFPEDQKFTCEGVSVWMTHIGGYPGHYQKRVRDKIYANPPKLFISGHSHILKVMYDKKINCMHMNPGAAGFRGFHKKCTSLRFTIDGENIKDLEVLEFENKDF